MVYDLWDRQIQKTSLGQTLNFDYDANGNRTVLQSPGGQTNFTYDAHNRLLTVTDQGKATVKKNGLLQKVSHPNGTEILYSYDQANRLLSVVNQKTGGPVISSFSYTYDTDGNRLQQIELQNGLTGKESQSTSYTYDENDRLKSFTVR